MGFFLQSRKNLSDVANAATALANLGGGGGGSGVTSVTAADPSVIIGGTTALPTVATGTLDVIAAQHPPVAAVAMNGQKHTGMANGSAATDSAAYGQILAFQATTGNAGYTLVNGTGTILSWTAPADGNMHRVLIFAVLYITTTETGGQITLTATVPNGNSFTPQLFGGSQGTGGKNLGDSVYLIESGTTITINQASALSAGAAVAWAEIWAS